MLTAYTENRGHKYVVSYDHKTYPVALTVVLGWHERGLIGRGEAVELYMQMYREWIKGEEVC
jgi:hypothetical protein